MFTNVRHTDALREALKRRGVVAAVADEHPALDLATQVEAEHLAERARHAFRFVPWAWDRVCMHRRDRGASAQALDERDQGVDLCARQRHRLAHIESKVASAVPVVVGRSYMGHR